LEKPGLATELLAWPSHKQEKLSAGRNHSTLSIVQWFTFFSI